MTRGACCQAQVCMQRWRQVQEEEGEVKARGKGKKKQVKKKGKKRKTDEGQMRLHQFGFAQQQL